MSVSVVKCDALDDLATVTKQTLSSSPVDVNTLLGNLYNYDKRYRSNAGYVGYYDMKQLMQYLSSDMEAWTLAADKAVVYWKTAPKNYSGIIASMFSIPQDATCGFSHYIPLSTTSAAAKAYRSTSWYEAAGLSQISW